MPPKKIEKGQPTPAGQTDGPPWQLERRSDLQVPFQFQTGFIGMRKGFFTTSLCGVLGFDSVSRCRPPAVVGPWSASRRRHNLSSHHLLNLSTHNLSTRNLSSHILSSPTCPHTTCSHTTCPHTSCHHTTCTHTTCPHTTCPRTQLAQTQLVALGDIDSHFAWPWQAWRLRHWAGSGGAPGSQMTPWTPRLFAWQAWHLVTSTFVLRGRCGAWWHLPSFTHHLSHTTLSPTIFDAPFFTHNFVTHHLWHITLPHTIFHTPSLTHPLSHHFSHTVTDPSFAHHLSHTTLSHTIFHHTILHTPLCHPPSFATPPFTHHCVTHHLSHTALSHALFHTQLCHTHTPSFPYSFVTHTHKFVLLLDSPPPPLSFLSSPSPLQHLVLIIGRSCLVGLSGPLICCYKII